MLSRLAFAAVALLLAMPVAAQVGQSWYPIKAEDGSPVANHRVPVELESQLDGLAGTAVVGNPRGDVTLVEFYDLNCPYCRKAADELHSLVAADDELKLVLVPLPILSRASVEAGRVELAAMTMLDAKTFFAFHQKLFASRGVVNGARALATAKSFGLDPKAVVQKANEPAITQQMIAHVRLADAMGLAATPSYVVKGVAIVGHPGKAALEGVIRSIRRCDKVAC